MHTEPLGIALSDYKSDHHSNHSSDDLKNIIWSVCESNMKVYKSDPMSRLEKKKTMPRLPQGVRNIKRELNAAFSGKVRVNLLMVIVISIGLFQKISTHPMDDIGNPVRNAQ